MLLESLLGIGGKLVERLIPDPAAKAQAQLELAKMAQDGELARMANETDIYKTEQTKTKRERLNSMMEHIEKRKKLKVKIKRKRKMKRV